MRNVVGVAGLLVSLLAPQRDTEFQRALANQNLDTEAPLRYRLQDCEFVEHTRVTRLNFVKIRTYRTVERYVQRDYEKLKIYSDWKERESKIPTITLKLTNNVLENLRDAKFLVKNGIVKKSDTADLISDYAFEILYELIVSSEKAYLMPSWMERILLKKEWEQETDILENEKVDCEYSIKAAKDKICKIESESEQLFARIQKISSARDNMFLFILLSILSLGYYAFANSGNRLKELISQFDEGEQNNPIVIDALNKEINSNSSQLRQNCKDMEKVNADYSERIKQVKGLADYNVDSTDFVPLKNLSGLDYQKIKGVYIIRNRELDKIYVGQSKDVLKRLTDHFTGTEPKNIIFAEDYYQSKFDNKEELFEFKIEILETKDELDKREKDLIAEYGAFNSGYNKTAGNS